MIQKQHDTLRVLMLDRDQITYLTPQRGRSDIPLEIGNMRDIGNTTGNQKYYWFSEILQEIRNITEHRKYYRTTRILREISHTAEHENIERQENYYGANNTLAVIIFVDENNKILSFFRSDENHNRRK